MALAETAWTRQGLRFVVLAAAVAALVTACSQDPNRESNLSPYNTTFGKGPNSWR